MKRHLLILLTLALVNSVSFSQELPIFSQKINNGVLYNPSQAGLHSGAVDLSYQRQWSGLDRSINNLYAGVQNHFAQGRVGVSANVFREKFNLLNSTFLSGAVAYHLPFGNNSGISMGVSAEYSNVMLDLANLNVTQENDPLINNFPGYNHIDFGFGFTLSLQQFQIGASTVRFTNFLSSERTQEQDYFPAMITGFAAYKILLADEASWLEPRLNYRYVENQLSLIDAGLYFTYNSLITAGATYRSTIATNSNSGAFNGSVAVHLQNFTIAYSRQSLASEFSSNLGGSDEITLRYTFNENLSFFGSSGGSNRRGRIGGRAYDNSSNKLMNRNAKKPRSNLFNRKERLKMRNYKGKYRKLLKKKG